MRRRKVNIKVVTWLVKHRDVLSKVIEVAKGYRKDASYTDQWAIVDSIARLILPVLEAESVQPKAFFTYGNEDIDGLVESLQDGDVQLLSAGSEVAALGIDWKLFVEVILPIVISILEALAGRR
jgi:hypothetical protein